MKKEFEKSIKHWLKRKITITLATVIGILIAGVENFANINIGYDSEQEKITIDKEIGSLTEDDINGWIWANSGEIYEHIKVNGIRVDNKKFNIINRGSISVSGERSEGNAIDVRETDVKNLINSGKIFGKNIKEVGGGNGIQLYIAKVDKLNNIGIVAGIGNVMGLSSNGIYINSGSVVTKFINDGKFLGKNTSAAESGTGMSIKDGGTRIEDLINNGIIVGDSKDIANQHHSGIGIIIRYGEIGTKIENLNNNGLIAGKSKSGFYTGIGILLHNNSGELGNINNRGIISGDSNTVEKDNPSGIGILINANTKAEKINNYGIIAGNNKAIKVTNDINSGEIINQNNYGLLIDGAGIENQKITAEVNGEQTIDGNKKYIINGVDKAGENATAIAIKSSELKNKIKDTNLDNYYEEDSGYHKNLIVNVVGDDNNSLNVDKSLSVLDSIINGYKDAIVFTKGNNKFHGENVIINSGENLLLVVMELMRYV